MTTLQQSLPTACYLKDAFYEREREAIFCREWLAVAREEDVAPGTALVLDVVGESVLLARTRDGALAAHYNVCRHRGSRLCSAGDDGVARTGITPAGTIRCAYHSWRYGLDGRLLATPHLAEQVDRGAFSLYPVGVATWAGYVFVNLTPGEARSDLATQLGGVPERLARYPLRDLRVGRRIDYDLAANWKVVAENYNECYHCAPVHPELCEIVPAFKRGGGGGLDWDRGIPHRDGAWTFTRSGTTTRAPFPGLSEDERTLHKGELVYPNLFLSLSADHVAAFRLQPAGPERTTITCEFLFHPDAMVQPDFDPSDAVDFWDLVNRQDWAICEQLQKGLHARPHRFGYYAPMEDMSLDIRRYVESRVGDVGE